MTPKEIITYFKDKFKKGIKNVKIEKKTAGVKKNEFVVLWMEIDRKIFKNAVKELAKIQFPHLAVISGEDIGKEIKLNYHFSLYYAKRLEEISINFSVKLPKNNPSIETITDIIPGALITEREIQEMLGVKIKNIPDKRRMFLSNEFPKSVYPWRKDEKGINDKLINKLYMRK